MDVGVGVGIGGDEAKKFLGSTSVHDGSSFLWIEKPAGRAREGEGVKTIFQTESYGEERLSGTVKFFSDGAVEGIYRLGSGLNMRKTLEVGKNTSVLIEIEDARTGKVIHTFLVTNSLPTRN